MNTTVYEQYAKLKQQIAELEEQRRELEIQVLDTIDEENSGKPVETIFGTFWPMGRTTYEYSSEVAALNEKVKAQKKKEEQLGIASVKSSSRYIRLTTKKE